MVYIEYDKQTNEVTYLNNDPFGKYDMGKSQEELLARGVFVIGIPVEEKFEGKKSSMKYNPSKDEVYYEYKHIPREPTLEEVQAQTFLNTELLLIYKELEMEGI